MNTLKHFLMHSSFHNLALNLRSAWYHALLLLWFQIYMCINSEWQMWFSLVYWLFTIYCLVHPFDSFTPFKLSISKTGCHCHLSTECEEWLWWDNCWLTLPPSLSLPNASKIYCIKTIANDSLSLGELSILQYFTRLEVDSIAVMDLL